MLRLDKGRHYRIPSAAMLLALVRDHVKAVATHHRVPLNLAAFLIVVLAAWYKSPTVLYGFQVRSPQAELMAFPYTFKWGKGTYVFEGTLVKNLRTPGELTVRVDDCIETISLDDQPPFFSARCAGCDNCQQKHIALPKNIAPGPHKMTLKVKDHGGLGIIDIVQAHGVGTVPALVFFCLGLAWFLIIWWRKQPTWQAWLGVLAMFLGYHYWMVTDPFTRQHDVDGHREYIEHLIRHAALPKVKEYWESWQPPMYYALAALWANLTGLFTHVDVFRRAQLFAYVLYVLNVALAILVWRRFNFPAKTGWLGLVLFAVLPANVFLTARVNNDVLMPLWGLLVLLVANEYAQRGRLPTLSLLAVVLLGAMVTKTSSLSLVAGAGLVVLYKDHVDRRPLLARLGRALVVGMPAAIWLAFWLLRNKEQTGEYLYVNAALNDSLRVPNVAWKYLSFDVRAFLSESGFNTFSGKVRESYPTALAMSILFGEFSLEWWTGLTFQSFIRAAFLPLVLMFVFGLFTAPRPGAVRPWVPAVLVFVAHGLFMVSYNWRYSYACNEDARLWSPMFFPAAVLWSWAYEASALHARGRLATVVKYSPYVFLIMLAVFWRNLVLY